MLNPEMKLNRRSFVQYSAVLGTGVALGAVSSGNVSVDRIAFAATPGAIDATATRAAELGELHALQTEVAQELVCTPAATASTIPPTATATQVPLASTGVPLPYLDIWTITVLGIVPVIAPNDLHPNGKFMLVNLTAAHTASTPTLLMLPDFLLTDSAGRFSIPNVATNQKFFGLTWGLHIQPGVTENMSIVFDVAADAGDSFILESKADPTIRVGMTVEQRG